MLVTGRSVLVGRGVVVTGRTVFVGRGVLVAGRRVLVGRGVLVRGRRVLVGRGVLVRGRSVLVGRGVFVTGRSVLVGRGVLVSSLVVLSAEGAIPVEVDPADTEAAVALLASAVCLALVGESGRTGWVASREDVIGINGICPTNVPEAFGTQQLTSVARETRHQDRSAVLPITSTVCPDGILATPG